MALEEELAFLKAHLISLPPAVMRQLKKEIIERKKEAAIASKASEPGERTTSLGSRRQPGPSREESAPTQKASLCKRKANELYSSSPGGSLETDARRPAPAPLSEAGFAPLHAEKEGSKFALGLGAASTGETAKTSR